MKFHKNKFLAFIAGAALVLAVGACSSSSDDDEMAGTPPPATTDPTPESTPELTAAEQLTAAETAVVAAKAMVDALMDSSTAEDAAAAYTALGNAQTALHTASGLPENKIAAKQAVIDDLQAEVDQLTMDLEALQNPEGPSAETIAEGMLVAMAIGPMSTRADLDANTAGIQMPFMANGRKLTEEPPTTDDTKDDFAMAGYAPATITGWQGAKYTRTTAADAVAMTPEMTDTVVRYTDQADPTDQAYTVYYSDVEAENREGVASGAGGVLVLEAEQAGNHALFVGDFGITAAHQTIPAPVNDPATDDVDEGIVSVMGSFTGVPGTFACPSECTRSSDEDGNLITFGGSWTFTPAKVAEGADPHMVPGVIADPDYLTFGQWRRDTVGDDGTESGISAFAMGNELHNAQQVTGTAKYEGAASGTYMKKTFDGDGNPTPIASGQFTADSELTAYFGQLNDAEDVGTIAPNLTESISGSVTDFRNSAGDMINPGWTVEFMKTTIGSDGDFTGMATGMGEYSGQFYGDSTEEDGDTPMPSSAAGTFDGHFSNGHVLGAFAARKK